MADIDIWSLDANQTWEVFKKYLFEDEVSEIVKNILYGIEIKFSYIDYMEYRGKVIKEYPLGNYVIIRKKKYNLSDFWLEVYARQIKMKEFIVTMEGNKSMVRAR